MYEKDFKESHLFEVLFENSDTMNCFFDVHSKLIVCNSSYKSLFSHYVDFLKTHLGENLYPEYFKELKHRISSSIRHKKSKKYISKFKLNDQIIWFESNYIPLFDHDGVALGVQIISNDISREIEIQEELEKKDHFINKARQLARFGGWEWNIQTNKVTWTEETYHIFAIPEGTPMQFEEFLNYIEPDDIEKFYQVFNEAAINKESFSFEIRITAADNTKKFLYAIADPVYNENGEIINLFGTIQDITEQIEIKNTIIGSEQRYRKLFEMISDPVILVDRGNAQVLEMNNAALEIYGYTRDEALELKFTDLSPEPQKTSETLKSGQIKYPLTWHKRKNGRIFPVEISSANFKWKGMNVQTLVCRDISERMRIDKSLRDFERIFNMIGDIICIVSFDGFIVKINPAVEKILGYAIHEIQGKNIVEFIHPEDLNPTLKYIEKSILLKKDILTIENRYKCKDGNFRWLAWSTQAIYDENISFSIAHDITQMKNVEKQLTKAKDKAEESDRLKTAFLANMSHEIRTPMNGIIGFSDILIQDGLSEEKRARYAEIINRNCNRLLEIINDIIDVSKIETGQTELKYTSVDLNHLFDDLYAFYSPLMNNNVSFSAYVDKKLKNKKINTDILKLRQVLDNLINNARKFTEKGHIKIGVALENNQLHFFVEDSGKGIEKKYVRSIFKRFVQINSDQVKKQHGTGLGLAICKAYIKKLGGKISVKSELNKGTIFIFNLPLTN